MTAATDVPVRPRTPRPVRAVPLTAARLLRIELRRSPPHDLGAALCASAVFAAGVVAVTALGVRDPGRK